MKGGKAPATGSAKNEIVGLIPEEDQSSAEDSDDWKPRLRKTQPIGSAQGGDTKRFQWPEKKDLQKFPLNKKIKLSGFGFKANTNLY